MDNALQAGNDDYLECESEDLFNATGDASVSSAASAKASPAAATDDHE